MRLQLIFFTLLFSSLASAVSDKEVSEVFAKYDTIVREQKFDLVDEVFTAKFLKDVGGKDEFIQNIKDFAKEESALKSKSLALPTKIQWKKGVRDEIYFAKKVEVSNLKSNASPAKSDKSFILKKENGKLKIDGTISDDH